MNQLLMIKQKRRVACGRRLAFSTPFPSVEYTTHADVITVAIFFGSSCKQTFQVLNRFIGQFKIKVCEQERNSVLMLAGNERGRRASKGLREKLLKIK